MSAGFYKFANGGLRYTPTFIHAPGYSLHADNLANLELPVDGWDWYDSQDAAEAALLTVEAPPATALTEYAFRNRFTQTEQVTLEIASLDNPAAPMEERQVAAALRTSRRNTSAARWVDLADPATIAGVQALEYFGVIAQGRAATILTAPIQQSERP